MNWLGKGSYLLVLCGPQNILVENLKLMGGGPCYSYETLKQAQAAKERMEKETVYTCKIVQIV
jgi:hypothetical protein